MLPTDAEIGGCSGPLHKTVWYLHIPCAHPPETLSHLQAHENAV